MPYNRNFRRSNGGKSNYVGKRKKYTQAEQIAFSLGQQQRVKESLATSKPSRVKDAFSKGYGGVSRDEKKPLY